MTDRSKSYENAGYMTGKMVNDLGPRKTMLVLVIVVGCFAVLWPKVFYPMILGTANSKIKPSSIDRTQGCCDVLYEKDVTTIKLMSEICSTIIRKDNDNPMSSRELIQKCQNIVLDTCGMDISAILQEQVRLGHTTKQILQEIRSLNGSLCLKYNFGVATWKLGVPHRITVKVSPSSSIKQERPLHLRSEMVHPAFRERGRAIPITEFSPTKPAPPSRLIPKVIEGRPGPVPGMRPTIGGAGHVVPPPKQGAGNSMGLIMPIYTIGIVIFFTYTVMKIVFKKQPEVLYPPIVPDPHFRREVFEADRGHRTSKDGVSSKLGFNEMDQLEQRLMETETAMERIVEKMAKLPLNFLQEELIGNGSVVTEEDDQSSVHVLGMETTASRESGQKWTRSSPTSLPVAHPHAPETPPQEIFLEGSLPPQSHLLVTDSATEAQKADAEEDPAVVLAGKMTLSVISLDSSETGTDESSNSGKNHEDRSSGNVSDEFEKIDIAQLDDIVAETENAAFKIENIAVKDSESSKEFVAHEAEAYVHQVATFDEIAELVNTENDGITEPDTTSVKSAHTADDILKEEVSLTGVEKSAELKEGVSLVRGDEAIETESENVENPNTVSIENIIQENVDAVVETIQDKQKELDTLLLKSELDLVQTTEFVDNKIEQIQQDIERIEMEQMAAQIEANAAKAEPNKDKEIVGNAEDKLIAGGKEFEQNIERDTPKAEELITKEIKMPAADVSQEGVQIREIIDNIKEELTIEEIIIPSIKKEPDENVQQEIAKLEPLSTIDVKTSAADVTQNEAPIKDIKDEPTMSGVKKETDKDKEQIHQVQEVTTADLTQKDPIETIIQPVSNFLIESGSKGFVRQEKRDIKQEKEKTDIIDRSTEATVGKIASDLDDELEELAGRDYGLDSGSEEEDEIENEERIEKIETTRSQLEGAVLLDKENSEHQHEDVEEEYEEDGDEEYDEEGEDDDEGEDDEEDDDEEGGEIDQESVEYLTDEEEEEEEVEVEEEEEENLEETDKEQNVSHV